MISHQIDTAKPGHECLVPVLTQNGKRRGRKPGLNSTLAQRSAANARERSRMRVLSSAFVELKGALPWVPKDTKLSKLDTLKLAAGYIAYLKRLLDSAPLENGVNFNAIASMNNFSCEQFLKFKTDPSILELDQLDFGSDDNETNTVQTPDSSIAESVYYNQLSCNTSTPLATKANSISDNGICKNNTALKNSTANFNLCYNESLSTSWSSANPSRNAQTILSYETYFRNDVLPDTGMVGNTNVATSNVCFLPGQDTSSVNNHSVQAWMNNCIEQPVTRLIPAEIHGKFPVNNTTVLHPNLVQYTSRDTNLIKDSSDHIMTNGCVHPRFSDESLSNSSLSANSLLEQNTSKS